MKICLFLHRRFTPLGHAMATTILREHPGTEFCAYVSTRQSRDLLQNQTDVPYTALLFEEEVHNRLYHEKVDHEYLAWLEKEYGIPNLWPYLYVDRVVMNGHLLREYPYDQPLLTHEQMLQKLQSTAKAIIAFLETEKPDVIVTAVIGSVGSKLLYHIAKKKGIKTIHIEFARIGNRIALSSDYRNFSWVKERFEALRQGAVSPEQKTAETFIREFREKPVPYDIDTLPEFYRKKGRIENLRFLMPTTFLRSLGWHTKTLLGDLKRKKNREYTDIFIWWQVWDKLKRKIRGLVGFDDLYSAPDLNAAFAYYALHIEPEIAMLLYAPYYTNQIELIRATAHALPINMFLYVKEHPGMVGYRTRRFYNELLKIPNVRLIPPHVSGNTLAQHAKLSLTITSTSGWESLLLKKPVITFGDVFYNDIPGVKRCTGFEELPYLIQEQLTSWQHDETALVHYTSALLEDSVAVDFSGMWNRAATKEEALADEGMIALSRLLAAKAGL